MKSLKKLIGNQAHWTLNKELVKKIGLVETLVLQHLIDLNENIFDGEFYQQMDRIAEELTIGEWKVKECIKTLKDRNLIIIEKKGMPAKNYYKINGKEIIELMIKDELQQVSRKSPNKSELPQLVENHLTSEVKINSQVDRFSTDKEKKQEQEINKNKKDNSNTVPGKAGNMKEAVYQNKNVTLEELMTLDNL